MILPRMLAAINTNDWMNRNWPFPENSCRKNLRWINNSWQHFPVSDFNIIFEHVFIAQYCSRWANCPQPVSINFVLKEHTLQRFSRFSLKYSIAIDCDVQSIGRISFTVPMFHSTLYCRMVVILRVSCVQGITCHKQFLSFVWLPWSSCMFNYLVLC